MKRSSARVVVVTLALVTSLGLGNGSATATTDPGVQATPSTEGGEWWVTQSDYCTPPAVERATLYGVYFDFAHACLHHDGCYQNHWADRPTCDQWFLNDMSASCAELHGWYTPRYSVCAAIALGYYNGVRIFGKPFYDQHSMATPMSATA